MANPLVDKITHPGNEDEFPLDLDAVVEAAVRHNVILELNDHCFDPHELARRRPPRASASSREAALAAGAPVAIGSDAHYALHVGRFDAALAVAEELGLAEDRIVNRDAASVLAHLLGKRERPRLDAGGDVGVAARRRGDAEEGGAVMVVRARAQEPPGARLRADDASAS